MAGPNPVVIDVIAEKRSEDAKNLRIGNTAVLSRRSVRRQMPCTCVYARDWTKPRAAGGSPRHDAQTRSAAFTLNGMRIIRVLSKLQEHPVLLSLNLNDISKYASQLIHLTHKKLLKLKTLKKQPIGLKLTEQVARAVTVLGTFANL